MKDAAIRGSFVAYRIRFWLKLAPLDPKIVSTAENIVSSSSGRRLRHLEISKIPGFLFRGPRQYICRHIPGR